MATKKRVVKRPPIKQAEKTVKPTGDAYKGTSVRTFHVGQGLPSIPDIRSELQDMTDVLLGRTQPPVDHGVTTLLEVADAYFARATEITMKIHEGELDGTVARGSTYYKLRTGELRDFLEMAKRAADLGSRRLTSYQLEVQLKRDNTMLGYNDERD